MAVCESSQRIANKLAG